MSSEPTYGALLVHGFTGSPFEMSLLGAELERRLPGLRVVIPTLPGHGADHARLVATGWPDWAGAVDRAFSELRATCDRTAVVGLSLGGLLSLELASRRSKEIAALVSLSAPMRLNPFIMRGARRLARGPLRNIMLPILGGSDIADLPLKKQNDTRRAHHGIPLSALLSLLDLMDHLPAELARVTAPLLCAHSIHDHTAPFDSMESILRRVASPVREKLILERSFHVITLDIERAQVFTRVAQHLSTHLYRRS